MKHIVNTIAFLMMLCVAAIALLCLGGLVFTFYQYPAFAFIAIFYLLFIKKSK